MAALLDRIPLQAAHVGLGFALGFGWLWFPGLQARWLPEVLWGTPVRGGGGLFLAVLLAGLLAFDLWGDRLTARGSRFSRAHPGHTAHGASLALLALAVLPAWTGAGPYPPVLFLAVLALCQGLYWGGALLALPPGESGPAFLTAALAQAGLCLLYQSAPENAGRLLMLLSVAGAWVTLGSLARLMRRRAEESRRPRGRPPKNQEAAGPAPDSLLPVTAGAAFVVLAAAGTLLPPAASMPLAGIASACGAAAGFLLCRLCSSLRLLSPAPALVGLVLAFFPGAAWSWMAAPFAEGLFCLPALVLITRSLPAGTALPAQRAARCLGIVLVLAFVAGMPAIFMPQALQSAVLPFGIVALLLAAALCLLPPRPGLDAAAAAAAVPEQAHAGSGLTRREADILRCLAQGMSDGRIADHLAIKETTVRYHLANMFRKTGYRTRAKLVAYAHGGSPAEKISPALPPPEERPPVARHPQKPPRP